MNFTLTFLPINTHYTLFANRFHTTRNLNTFPCNFFHYIERYLIFVLKEIQLKTRQEEIALVINSQKETFLKQDTGFTRDALVDIPIANSFATIITGICRCGKSTLLLQLLRRD